MKIFVWEENGISDGYHDDGTLVVLAEDAKQAREIVRATASSFRADRDEEDNSGRRLVGDNRYGPTSEGATKDYWAPDAPPGARWDGDEEALDREPDHVYDLETPRVIAFNGGGYD